jgi:hypothetical protein
VSDNIPNTETYGEHDGATAAASAICLFSIFLLLLLKFRVSHNSRVHVLFSCSEAYTIRIIHLNNFDAAVLYISPLPEQYCAIIFIV